VQGRGGDGEIREWSRRSKGKKGAGLPGEGISLYYALAEGENQGEGDLSEKTI